MSSQHQYMSATSSGAGSSSRVGEIEHISHLSENIGSLCLSAEYSDVTLVVEGVRIPAHKVILAASSDYFRALLYGGMREASQAEVELQAPLQAFKALLRYVYSGHMGLSVLREETVLDMLGLAHQFNFQELEAAISDYLRQVLALRNVCSVLDAARLYGLDGLMNYCFNFLDKNAAEVLVHESFLQLSVEALQSLLERDSFFAPEVDIFKAVCRWFDANQQWVKSDAGQAQVSPLERDSFFAPEVDIFKAVCRWFDANQQWVKSDAGQAQVEKILKSVRLTLMSLEELLTVARPFPLVTADMLLDAIQEKTSTSTTDLRHRGIRSSICRLTLMSLEELVTADMLLDAIQEKTSTSTTDLRHRGIRIPEENIATPKRGARVITGDMRSSLLDGDTESYDMERGYTRHSISEDNPGLIVRLQARTIINHIRLLLWDRDNRSYTYYIEVSVDQKEWVRVVDHSRYYCRSWQNLYFEIIKYVLSYTYYIEVSVDQKEWVRVVDHSRYYCRSWQNLYFEPRVVQYIKVVGTSNTVNKVFHAVALEAMYTSKVPPLCDGLVRPVHNVATVELSAVVIEGISRTRNALLNGDTTHYDWEGGYTCHQLGPGAIVVQLAQPYLLGSLRLLLWDCDYRHYSYFVETSVNSYEWETVADRTRDACRSWQVLYFTPRPVSIIRIVGTNNSVNEVFHLVHLECPAQVDDAKEDPVAKKHRPSPDNRLNPNNNNESPPSPSSGDDVASDAASDGSSRPYPRPAPPPLPPPEPATEAEE